LTVKVPRKETAVKKVTSIALILALGGCANFQMSREEMLGTAAGAAVGGIVGYQLGGGIVMNSLFATAGTLAGGTAGYVATRALMGSDRAAYDETTKEGLASADGGQIVEWQNPETGSSGIFRATGSYRNTQGQRCRQYRSAVAFTDGVRSGAGIACEQADGNWKVVADDFS
jgi:surface antigen